MKSYLAQTFIDEVNSTVSSILTLSPVSEIEKSYLAQFLVVYICGVYEEVIEIIISEMVGKCRNREIDHFMEKYLENHFSNPRVDRINDLLAMFNDNWKKKINELDPKLLSALTSIVTNKNQIAHGQKSNITIDEVVNYYKDSKLVIEKIDDLLL